MPGKKMTQEEAAVILHELKRDMLTGAVRKFKAYNDEELLSSKFYDALNVAIEVIEKGGQ